MSGPALLIIATNNIKAGEKDIFQQAMNVYYHYPISAIKSCRAVKVADKSFEYLVYSHSPPGCTSHASPRDLIKRFRHNLNKNIIYVNKDGSIYRPGVEIYMGSAASLVVIRNNLKIISLDQKSFGIFWDMVLSLGKNVARFIWWLRNDSVVDFYCAEDKSFYGALHKRYGKIFASVLARNEKDALRGFATLTSLMPKA